MQVCKRASIWLPSLSCDQIKINNNVSLHVISTQLGSAVKDLSHY